MRPPLHKLHEAEQDLVRELAQGRVGLDRFQTGRWQGAPYVFTGYPLA